ncbi:MAG: DMT family transporter [Chloroflexi bacterium]|nr:DMT family transporter [Chloroflexota bacterium]MBI3733595.1 DMT family transporter [Chloroflexota bacterium]
MLDSAFHTQVAQPSRGWPVAIHLLLRRGLGWLIVLLSAASFGAVSPFARLAYDHGANVITLMVVRYALAGLAVMGYFAWRRQPWRLAGRQRWLVLLLAFFLGVVSFTYLSAIRYIPVSLAALIYYTYPIMVSLMAHITSNDRLRNIDRGAYTIAFGGQALSLAGLAMLLGQSSDALNMTGVLLAAFSAFGFALVMVMGSRVLRTVSPMVLNLHVALVNMALFAVAALLGLGFDWPTATVGWIGLLGVAFFFIIGFLGLFVGVRLIGVSRAACLTNLEPVVTVVLAITLLHEYFSLWQLVGAVGVLIGIFTMCRNVVRESRPARSLREPHPVGRDAREQKRVRRALGYNQRERPDKLRPTPHWCETTRLREWFCSGMM